MVVCEGMLNDVEEVGYGTAYERKLLNELLKRLVKVYGVRSILEYPATDLLGDPRILYEGVGVLIERSRCAKARDRKYDLVWNFCEMERADDPLKLLAEMVKLTAKYIMLIGQNVFNAGVFLHRAYHVLRRSTWDHGATGRMRLGYAMKLARARGLAILEHGYFDAPIFVLDLYEIGLPLRRSFVGRSGRDFLVKESPFENLPRAFKPAFSHHWYLLCQLS
jgi:SAM-dependent methyltransferase